MEIEMTKISIDTIIQVVSIIGAVLAFIFTQTKEKRKDRQITNREAYQQIELAAIDLFRFEAENLDLIRPVWESGGKIPDKESAEYTATMNYVCQMLNLFEIVLRYRKQRVILPDVFGSWVSWFYTLLEAPGFPEIWEVVKWDYLSELRNIMNGGLEILKENIDDELKEDKFYDFVGFSVKCKITKQWKTENSESSYASFMKKRAIQLKPEKTGFDTSQLKIDWITGTEHSALLAEFFSEFSGNLYISHSEIQEGRATDEKTWTRNLKEHLNAEFSEILKNEIFESGNIAGAWLDDKLTGFILLEYNQSPGKKYATLSDIVVDKKYRRYHIGSSILDWALPKIKEQGYTTLFAESNILNDPAHSFLEKSGFKTISKVFKMELG